MSYLIEISITPISFILSYTKKKQLPYSSTLGHNQPHSNKLPGGAHRTSQHKNDYSQWLVLVVSLDRGFAAGALYILWD